MKKNQNNPRKRYNEEELIFLAKNVFEIYVDKYNKNEPLQYSIMQPSSNKEIIHKVASEISMSTGTAENYSERLFNLWNELNDFGIHNGLEKCPSLLKKAGNEVFDKNRFVKKSLINSFSFEKALDEKILNSKNLSKEERAFRLKNSPKKPTTTEVVTKQYNRNPDVIVEVLDRAKGICEKCQKSAPFLRAKDNTPYLEVHHIEMLADDGDDTVENAIAVCPNCHRELHFG